MWHSQVHPQNNVQCTAAVPCITTRETHMARGDPGFPTPLNAVQSSMSSTKAGARLDSPRFHLLQGMYLDVGFVTQLQVGKIFSAVPLLVARECLPGFRYMQRRAIPRTTSRNLKGGDRLRFEPNLGLGALLLKDRLVCSSGEGTGRTTSGGAYQGSSHTRPPCTLAMEAC